MGILLIINSCWQLLWEYGLKVLPQIFHWMDLLNGIWISKFFYMANFSNNPALQKLYCSRPYWVVCCVNKNKKTTRNRAVFRHSIIMLYMLAFSTKKVFISIIIIIIIANDSHRHHHFNNEDEQYIPMNWPSSLLP